ncbi:MarR family winged helix-turn-helix transcriptional regulator [Planococcus sp. NCCP-2050]|uniref:MarR family winged helix-turn-helix transcriptional regulator n=1 Tax=Planococcus sp. NCCP-2050 TaxID=2944679 RepID=UPI00203F53A9|nr:MarR family transcriptional regulator [Planococcus sp. NCCP-2050]
MLMYRPFESQLNQELGKHGLHRAQWTILYYLVNEGPSTLVELAHYQRVEKPTMTRTVSRLEELGYVEHLPGKDRREKRMQLTAEGTKVYKKVRITIDKFEQEILEGIPEDTQQLIIESMKAIRMNLINKESTK